MIRRTRSNIAKPKYKQIIYDLQLSPLQSRLWQWNKLKYSVVQHIIILFTKKSNSTTTSSASRTEIQSLGSRVVLFHLSLRTDTLLNVFVGELLCKSLSGDRTNYTPSPFVPSPVYTRVAELLQTSHPQQTQNSFS